MCVAAFLAMNRLIPGAYNYPYTGHVFGVPVLNQPLKAVAISAFNPAPISQPGRRVLGIREAGGLDQDGRPISPPNLHLGQFGKSPEPILRDRPGKLLRLVQDFAAAIGLWAECLYGVHAQYSVYLNRLREDANGIALILDFSVKARLVCARMNSNLLSGDGKYYDIMTDPLRLRSQEYPEMARDPAGKVMDYWILTVSRMAFPAFSPSSFENVEMMVSA